MQAMSPGMEASTDLQLPASPEQNVPIGLSPWQEHELGPGKSGG